MKSFEGKAVLVTGASSGIGEATVVQFARAGANVFGLTQKHEALEAARAKHPEVRWLLADVVRPADLKAAVASIVDQVGRLDALVNNAGIYEFAPLETTTEQLIRKHFEINVFGLTFMTQAALPALVASRGAVVNLSSVVGHKAFPGASIYSATKAAVDSLTQSWALELAPKGVRVNAVAPGPVETEGIAKLGDSVEKVREIKAQLTSQVPLGRMANPDEIARWIVAMADPSVTWMTGAVLAIDGGTSLT